MAVSVGIAGGNVGFALAGGGSESTNIILTTVDAYVEGSSLGTAASKIGSFRLTATSTATIEAVVAAVAASVSFGGKVGVGVALGVSVARNFIGWDPHETVAAVYSSTPTSSRSRPANKVRIDSGRPRRRRLRVRRLGLQRPVRLHER